MARFTSSVCLSLLLGVGTNVAAWSASSTRRQAFSQISSAVVGVVSGASCVASTKAYPSEETPRVTTRMGGNLEAYQERGIRIMAPSGWNKFDGEVGAYDLKWQDLVDPTENIKISSTPVKSTTESVQALGDDVQALGEKLAAKRNAKLVSAKERLTDGILYYKFDFAIDDGTHQLLQLCVGKGRLWSLDASAKEKRWAKREEMFNNVLDSFSPTLA